MASMHDPAADLDLNPRLQRLRLRHLHLLDQIMRCGSLSAAAQRLGISQPGATKMLHDIEHALGHTLVERDARGGRLNRSGTLALERIRVALGTLSTLDRTLMPPAERPLIRLGILPLVGITALGQVVSHLLTEDTLPRLEIRTGTVTGLLDLLTQGRVDAVVGGLDTEQAPRDMHRLDVRPLWRNSLVAVGAKAHPLAQHASVSLSQAQTCEWVLMPHGSTSRRAFERAFIMSGLTPPPARIETDSFHIGLSLAASTRLLTVLPEAVYQQHRDRLSRICLDAPFLASSIVWITLRDTPQPPALQTLAQAFAHHQPQPGHET